MTEEQVVLPNTYIKYISPVSDINDKRNDQSWKNGYIMLTSIRLIFIPEIDNRPAEDKAISIPLSMITEVDKKIDLWKKIVGTAKILPIHHQNNNIEVISLISTSKETADLIKKLLFILILNGSDIDYVCPFALGGKIQLDKKPVNGKIYIDESKVLLVSEWLGKKQIEEIDLIHINDFQTSPDNSSGKGIASHTLTYLKDGTLISTLITAPNRIIHCLDKYVKLIKGVIETEEEAISLDEKQFMLLQMMYTSDIDAPMAMEMLGVSMEELEKVVHQLVQMKILRTVNENEVEITELGTKYIVEQMKKALAK
ncbi:MAG: CheF family chemotaxis protein [Candidatus Thermoplasmatota archaeon]